MKRLLVLMVTVLSIFILAACAPQDTYEPPTDDSELTEYTLEELSMYDGKDGADAYVAVDGYIYDVTDSPLWNNGEHNGYSAGNDLSEAINASPHGLSTLGYVPLVGKLVE